MPSRRQLLVAGSLAVAATAGCLGDDDDPEDPEPADDESDDDDTAVTVSDPDAPLVTTVDRRTADDNDEDTEDIVLATYGGVDDIGTVEYDDTREIYHVPIRFADETVDNFVAELEAVDGFSDPMAQELQVHVDGEVIGSYALGPDFAASMEDDNWDGSFSIMGEEAELEELRAEFDTE
ncbi:hypothetical protein D8Y22_07005 [Salinadaptatus halalkaliphilus]|uniref:Preprotein translocase subunit SecD n=1 Tax=Salinadaptatus halalkaliphilus TaxID=2419781 RepID=A0A4S3TN05_9EURY|nr:hypothetical protein [Salinadaptatus halalkaliphilus]THE65556.1 hypothetical protein D8Y22_07005 [Salinadaptatus halalkaliphilus]